MPVGIQLGAGTPDGGIAIIRTAQAWADDAIKHKDQSFVLVSLDESNAYGKAKRSRPDQRSRVTKATGPMAPTWSPMWDCSIGERI